MAVVIPAGNKGSEDKECTPLGKSCWWDDHFEKAAFLSAVALFAVDFVRLFPAERV